MKDIKTMASVFRAVKRLLSNEDKWIKGSTARTYRMGPSVVANNPLATCFCFVGAINRVAKDGTTLNNLTVSMAGSIARLMSLDTTESVITYNDRRTTTHADIMELCDLGILHCKQAGI